MYELSGELNGKYFPIKKSKASFQYTSLYPLLSHLLFYNITDALSSSTSILRTVILPMRVHGFTAKIGCRMQLSFCLKAYWEIGHITFQANQENKKLAS